MRFLLAPLRGPYLYGLWLLAALLVTAAYQVGGSYRWPMGDRLTGEYLVNFTGPERAGDVPFRWTAPSALLRVPGIGVYGGTVRVRLNGETWDGPPRTATVQVNDGAPVNLLLQPGWHEYAVPFTSADLWPGDLTLHLRIAEAQIPAAQRAPTDTRRLGVPMADVALDRDSRQVLPPPRLLGLTLALVALLYLPALWFGSAPRRAAAAIAGLLAAWAGALAFARLPATTAAPGLTVAVLVAVGLAVVLRPLLSALFRRGGVQITSGEWRVLAALFIGSLTFHATGLLDPLFVTLDHYARLHRLMELGDNPLYFLSHFLSADQGQTYAGQLGLSAVVPYSPLFYLAFDPLNWLLPDPDVRLQGINLVCSALEAANVFALFYTLKRGWGDSLAGLWAAAVAVAFPLSNLLFSDGGYPGIFAAWLLGLLFAALAAVYGPHEGSGVRGQGSGVTGAASSPATVPVTASYSAIRNPQSAIALALLTALALLAHTAQALLLGTTLVGFLALLAGRDRARFGGALAWIGGGCVLAFAGFYGFTATAVVRDLVPQIIAKLQAGGGIGKSPAKLGAPLLTGFWPQIVAHFAGWPVVLSVWSVVRGPWSGRRSAVGGRQLSVGGGQDEINLPQIRNPQSAIRNPLYLWLIASLLTFALFSVVDTWINLLQKHMIYAMPTLAVLNGLALAALWRRGRAGQALCVALWLILAVSSLVLWANRVVNYALPPGSG